LDLSRLRIFSFHSWHHHSRRSVGGLPMASSGHRRSRQVYGCATMMSPGLLKRQAGVDFVRWCHRGAVRWLIWSLRQGKLISSLFFVRTPSCLCRPWIKRPSGMGRSKAQPESTERRLTRRDLKVHEARATTYVGGR
jgi:hypothetical protein